MRGPATAAGPGTWKTLRADHLVTVDVTLDGGKHDVRKLRGAIAVARPDKFRLRALGPGGIALFDILVRGGEIKVLQAIRDPNASALGGVIAELAGDLSAAYALEPAPAGRTVKIERDVVILEEPTRTVRLSRFTQIAGQPVPLKMDVENRARRYRVSVEVREVEIDVTLAPGLFAE
jgi:hypothetical protein